MRKIIIKSALVTLAVVVGCTVLVFAVLSLGFPRILCGWCEQLGNYGFAVRYASLYYSYTGDIADLGRCVDDSILAESDGFIIEYASELVDKAEFGEYCELRDEEVNGSISDDENFDGISFSYRQYVFGSLASAYYRGGDDELAIGTAISALDADVDRNTFSSSEYSGEITGFPVNNALGSLALRVIENGDGTAGEKMLGILDDVTAQSDAEVLYLATLANALMEL